MVQITSETLFNTAAAITATIASLIFVFNVEFGYSPVSKVLLVAVFIAGVFYLTQRTTDRQLTVLGYGVAVTTGVGLFFDVASTFEIGDTLMAFGLLVIAGLLFALRTQLDEESHFVSPVRAKYVLGAVAALAVAVLLVDVFTGGLVYELQPENAVAFTDTSQDHARIGSVVVTNPTPFPERVQAPRYEACAVGNWSEFRHSAEPGEPDHPVRANANVQDGYNEYVFGFDTKRYPVEVYLEGDDLQGETFPVRTTAGCPDEETGSPYIALFETTENGRYGRPLRLASRAI